MTGRDDDDDDDDDDDGAVHLSGRARRGSPLESALGACGCDVVLERSALFRYAAARHQLEGVPVDELGDDAVDPWRGRHRLDAAVRFDREQQVSAAGALLAVMQRDGTMGAATSLASVREFAPERVLTVDDASLEALGVFAEDKHPSSTRIDEAARDTHDTTTTPAEWRAYV